MIQRFKVICHSESCRHGGQVRTFAPQHLGNGIYATPNALTCECGWALIKLGPVEEQDLEWPVNENPQNFLDELDKPLYDHIERGR